MFEQIYPLLAPNLYIPGPIFCIKSLLDTKKLTEYFFEAENLGKELASSSLGIGKNEENKKQVTFIIG